MKQKVDKNKMITFLPTVPNKSHASRPHLCKSYTEKDSNVIKVKTEGVVTHFSCDSVGPDNKKKK